MQKSMFFNSSQGDRVYKAEDWADYFSSFIGNGVFPNPSSGLQVMALTGMEVTVRIGKAWILCRLRLRVRQQGVAFEHPVPQGGLSV